MAVIRGSYDVLLNFQVNVRLMTELKHLNAFVRNTVSVAEKELSESVYRKKRGNYSYNIIYSVSGRGNACMEVCLKLPEHILVLETHARKDCY